MSSTIWGCMKQNRKAVGSKWVFHIKRGPDGSIEKYNTRIVAHPQGFTQIEGSNYNETFAPVTKPASLRAILALAAERDLEVHKIDVKLADLTGALHLNEIFMEPRIPGTAGHDPPTEKAVYGTKQGAHVWYEDISNTLKTMGYQPTEAGHAVFVRGKKKTLSTILLYIIIVSLCQGHVPNGGERDTGKDASPQPRAVPMPRTHRPENVTTVRFTTHLARRDDDDYCCLQKSWPRRGIRLNTQTLCKIGPWLIINLLAAVGLDLGHISTSFKLCCN